MIRPTPKLELSLSATSLKRVQPARESARGIYEVQFPAPNHREFHMVNSHGVRIMTVQMDERIASDVVIVKRLWNLLDEIEQPHDAELRIVE